MWQKKYTKWLEKDSYALSTGHDESEQYFVDVSTRIIKRLQLNKSDIVLDYGCSNGTITKKICKEVKTIYGVDFIDSLVNRAKNENSSKNIDYLCLNAVETVEQLRHLNINKVYIHNVVHNLDTFDNFISLMRNILSILPTWGGVLLADVPDKDKFDEFIKSKNFKQKIVFSLDRYLNPKIYLYILKLRNFLKKDIMGNTLWFSTKEIENFLENENVRVKKVGDGTMIYHRSDFLIEKVK